MTDQSNIKPTGKPLDLEDKEHCSVILSTDTMNMKLEGKFRQRERKLFVLLVHSVWDDIGIKRQHTLEVEKLKKVFREVAGVKGFNNWIWEYLENLANIKITFENERYKGIARLVSYARADKETGNVTFEMPEEIEKAIKHPDQYARLDTYFLVGLKGKYSVSLYQLLESKINLRKFDPKQTPEPENRYFEISLNELRNWLGVGDTYKTWKDFNNRVLSPSIEEINSNPIATTFSVTTTEVVGKRRKVIAIRFFLTKTEGRLELEKSIQTTKQAKEAAKSSFLIKPFRGTEVYEKAKELAPHHDIYQLESEWREYAKNQDEAIANPEAAFLGFIKKRVQEEQPQKRSNAFMSLFRKS